MTIKEQAEALFKNVGVFFLSCVGEDGYPLTKAVLPGRYRSSISELFFCTNTSSRFVTEIKKNGKSNVYFFIKALMWKGCMLKGDMEIIEDMSTKRKFWQDRFKNAYKERSYKDPDFCLLKFTAVSGRYYSMYNPQDFDI